MIHCPCGILQPNSPCMKEGKCSHFYPKQFQPQTLLDSNGYPVYRRRNNGHSISKNDVIIDNRYVVPYNPKLLKKYQAHINIEWCNQSTSIKYLFKYINKGYDKVTAVMVSDSNDAAQNVNIQNDELKEYLDCRYISPCEAAWRIFAFPIHDRKPVVERLYFHLPGQHNILYEDHDDIDDVLSKPTISYSKYLAWMNTNKDFGEARNLTYSQFVSKFVYNKRNRSWQPRKKGYTIGRLIWVPPTTGELFYLRMMIGSCKGPTSFEDIRTVANIQYPTYREACFAMGFLQDDREYVEAIKEAKGWGTTNYLRKLVRTENQIVIIVASSGIASLLLLGGRTAHSRFKIPVPIFEDSTCNIHHGTQLAELLNQTSLIIWDEAPMAHKFCFEALDQSLRDIITNKSNSNQIFGGKVIVFGGDFCQILSVIPRGTRSDIVNAAINSSYLWDLCEILTLTKNMRLHSNLESVDEQETATFAKWILDIGDEIIDDENDGYATIQVPAHLLITQYDDPISAIVKSTFPDLDQHHNNPEFFKSKAILASTNETVKQINHYVLSFILGDHMEYLSSDSVDKLETSEDSYFQSITTEFLNSLNTSGLPTHSIKLKIGSPIMLLRNLNQNQGLCNGTRLVVTKMAKHVIAADII
ncbi:hypothetical protein AAZV13_15G161800 [Glycine max]